jgi:hypothetical protein
MVVRADETRYGNFIGPVKDLIVTLRQTDLIGLPDLDDPVAFDPDIAIPEQPSLGVHGNDKDVLDDVHGRFSFVIFDLSIKCSLLA